MKPRNRPLLATIDAGDPNRFRQRRVETAPRKLKHNRARRKHQERREVKSA